MIGRYEARHSPLDRGPHPARVIPHGRVPFVPGAALVVRRHLRFDETLHGGEDVDLVWRARYVRYEPASRVEHAHRTTPNEWLARRVYYGRTAAPLAKRHPGNARPLHVSPWTTAAWAALATKHPKTALAITAAATGLLARESRSLPTTAAQIAGLGTLRSGPRLRRCADAGIYWPLAFNPRPTLFAPPRRSRTRSSSPTTSRTAPALWIGCLAAPHARAAAAVPRLAARTPYCRAVGAIARLVTGRRSKWVVIAAWVIAALAAFPFQSKLQALASDESGAFESRDAESTRVDETIEQRFPGGSRDHHDDPLHPRRAVHAAGRRARRAGRGEAVRAQIRTSG